MDTRNLGYLGLGTLAIIIALTLVGVPPEIWIPLVAIAGFAGLVFVILHARASGSDLAGRVVARRNTQVTPRAVEPDAALAPEPVVAATETKPVDVELVREHDGNGTPAVWLHHRGGRRVHRYSTAEGWTVQQVSTKDPDNPKKRVIGETLVFAREADAIAAADDLARGDAPSTTPELRPAPATA
jgi:hypothetical protein